MSADLSLKDQLDLVQKVWLEYSAKQRHHHTLQITTAGLFATSLIGGGIAVKNFPNLLGILYGEHDPASAVILIGIGAAIIVLALASSYEASQARKWKRLSNMVYNELTVSPALRTLLNFNNKDWLPPSAIIAPPAAPPPAAIPAPPLPAAPPAAPAPAAISAPLAPAAVPTLPAPAAVPAVSTAPPFP